MLAIDRQFVEPNAFQSAVTFFVFAALILGGTARIFGPIVGAIVFWFLVVATESFLSQAIVHDFLGLRGVIDPSQVGTIRFVLVGLVIMLLVIFRPQGILGSRREVMLSE